MSMLELDGSFPLELNLGLELEGSSPLELVSKLFDIILEELSKMKLDPVDGINALELKVKLELDGSNSLELTPKVELEGSSPLELNPKFVDIILEELSNM
jgi:hypothetical protein